MENLIVFESEPSMVRQCSDILIPGYLIIEPKMEVLYFSELPEDVMQLLA